MHFQYVPPLMTAGVGFHFLEPGTLMTEVVIVTIRIQMPRVYTETRTADKRRRCMQQVRRRMKGQVEAEDK